MNFFVAGFMPDPDDFEPGFHNDLVSKFSQKLLCPPFNIMTLGGIKVITITE